MKRYILTFTNLLFIFALSQAQLASDALRYSAVQYGGTARSMGVGNAMSVLGGDFGTLSINPAGIAVFRSSDLMFSMGYRNALTSSQLRDNATFDEPANKLTFNNIGFVLHQEPWRRESKWVTTNFGIGINQLGNFNRTIFYQGNSSGSLVTLFKNQLNGGQPFDDFGNGLAYDAEALFDSTIAGQKRYYSDFDKNENVTLNRSQTARTTGRVTELAISYGANFDEKLMLGATLGIPFAKYELVNNYSENDNSKAVPIFNSLSYAENYTADGTGINLKLGAIYRPMHALRIGLAFHTPTSYTFSEIRTTDFIYNLTIGGKTSENKQLSPEGNSKYIITTPSKAIGSVGFLFGQRGFITAEAEYINYSSAKIRFETPDSIGQTRVGDLKAYSSKLNEEIKATYQSAVNLRIGGEVVLDVFRLRVGVNLLGSAKKDDNTMRKIYTAGIGVRGKSAYFDVAYQYENQQFLYQPYYAAEPSRQPNVDVSAKSNNFVATLGFRF